MSASASNTTLVGRRLSQFAVRTEIENDSAAVKLMGRIASGSCACSRTNIVTAPASSARLTILGRFPITVWRISRQILGRLLNRLWLIRTLKDGNRGVENDRPLTRIIRTGLVATTFRRSL